jgi:UbiD family decarboxylase
MSQGVSWARPARTTAALLAALSSYYLHQKVAVAVDEDVDIYDPQDIAWSIATRVNPDTDVSIISDVRGHPMDLSLPEIMKPGFTIPQRKGSKMLIDATKPPTCDPKARALFERVRPPKK